MNEKWIKIRNIIPQILAVAFVLAGIFYWGFDTDKSIFKKNEAPSETPKEEQAAIQTVAQEDKYGLFLAKADESLEQKDNKKANFWIARFFSSASKDGMIGFIFEYISPLLKDYNFAPPVSFLSGKYDHDFLGWFIYSTYPMWDFNDNGQDVKAYEDTTFQLAGVKDGNYAAVVFGSHPMLETWSFVGATDDNGGTVSLTAVLGDPEEKMYLSVAELEEKINEQTGIYDDKKAYDKIEIDLSGRPLQHIWDPEFYDLDKDGLPEIFIRYNATGADGFVQELAIYKIEGDKLVLFKKFTGSTEGIARRINDNQIEVGEGVLGSDSEGHLGFSKFRLETWEYKNGFFSKISKKIIPHILLSGIWQDYYNLTE